MKNLKEKDAGDKKMLHEEKKLTKIVEELTIFFLGIGATKLSSDIEFVGKTVNIHFKADYDLKYTKQIEHMEALLKEQKNEAIEDFYL